MEFEKYHKIKSLGDLENKDIFADKDDEIIIDVIIEFPHDLKSVPCIDYLNRYLTYAAINYVFNYGFTLLNIYILV